jgi:PhoH-like ATPase
MTVPQSLGQTSGPKRTFVLDTNVLLYDPKALQVFEEHERDDHGDPRRSIGSEDLNGLGRNARMVSRKLDELRLAGPLAACGSRRGLLRVRSDGQPRSAGSLAVGGQHHPAVLALARPGASAVVLVTRDTPAPQADALGVTRRTTSTHT